MGTMRVNKTTAMDGDIGMARVAGLNTDMGMGMEVEMGNDNSETQPSD
jgi:hypothetical protein